MKKALVYVLFYISSTFVVSAQVGSKPNFIFIVVDDLNDYVQGFTDHPQVLTPNIKMLSDSGFLFYNNYSNAPGCAPSRTSFFSGKDINYTQVYNNDDYIAEFRDNFSVEKNNATVYSLPEILKDSGGYFTIGINKLFHNPSSNDFDKTGGPDICEKSKSWNNMIFFEDSEATNDLLKQYSFGNYFDWGMIPDSLEQLLEDYQTADTAISFIESYANGTANTCDKPFFLGVGFYKPHADRYIPKKYFPTYYLNDLYSEHFTINYNIPNNQFPYNGIVMPAQPEPIYADYFQLPFQGIARDMADNGNVYAQINNYIASLNPLPIIDDVLLNQDRKTLLQQTIAANYQMNYIAAIQYVDAQIGRIINTLNAHPEVKNNTIIILLSDNGYSLGEKRHWTKWTLWEPDIRVPLIIVDPSKSGNVVVKQPVSLLDIFPTVCDIAGTTYPQFDDGTSYPDGISLLPLLNNANLNYEKPVLITYKKNLGKGSCYPHYAVRNNRWHLIIYRENNNGNLAGNICDDENQTFENELYEVGINRETDPNEWNNIASNSDYQPVINYLEQWMPDSSMYLKKGFAVTIQNNIENCFVDLQDTVKLTFEMRDTTGLAISPPDNLIYKWSNSITNEIFFGKQYLFNFASINEQIFIKENKIIFYLEVLNVDSTIVQGFDLIYIYINENNSPSSSFDIVNLSNLTIQINNISVNGSYSNTIWDFGDGYVTDDFFPAPHKYAAEGEYLIKHEITYGNTNCLITNEKIALPTVDYTTPSLPLKCFPNPADDFISITIPEIIAFAAITIYDLSGRAIWSNRFLGGDTPFAVTIDISAFKQGIYMVNLETADVNYSAPFVVVR